MQSVNYPSNHILSGLHAHFKSLANTMNNPPIISVMPANNCVCRYMPLFLAISDPLIGDPTSTVIPMAARTSPIFFAAVGLPRPAKPTIVLVYSPWMAADENP